jgi:hypothetical protein
LTSTRLKAKKSALAFVAATCRFITMFLW